MTAHTVKPLAALLCVIVTTHTLVAYGEVGPKGTFNILLENDIFAGTDRHYTNGLKMSYLSAPFREGHQEDGRETADWRVGFHVGQSIFTPNDKDAAQPLPNQRPYAGWLYGGFSLLRAKSNVLDTISASYGTIGPDAKGEEVQNKVHDFFDNDRVRGWDNQLDNETGGIVVFERKWRNLYRGRMTGLELDVMPHVGMALGNIEAYANAGITLRIGNDLANDFGPPRIRPSLPGSGFFEPQDRWGWYLFLGVDGRYVEENIFLEGDGPVLSNIEKEDWVADAQAGLVLTRRNFRFSYTLVQRSKEFDRQDEADRFGSLALTWRF